MHKLIYYWCLILLEWCEDLDSQLHLIYGVSYAWKLVAIWVTDSYLFLKSWGSSWPLESSIPILLPLYKAYNKFIEKFCSTLQNCENRKSQTQLIFPIYTYNIYVYIPYVQYIWRWFKFGSLMISDSIATLNVRQLKCIMSIRQGIYTQHCLIHQTKCLSICLAFQFANFNVHQMYCVYSVYTYV